MRVKASRPLSQLAGTSLSPLLRVFLELNQLKLLYRQGWLRRGVPDGLCESVADHTFGVTALALFLLDACFPELDRERVLRMAVLHDFGEIHAGDLTPADGVTAEEKRRRETASVERVLADLPAGGEYAALWAEYTEGRTPEARFLHEVDRLEMALQAAVYERQGLGDLSEFHDSVDRALSSPALRAILDELAELRRA